MIRDRWHVFQFMTKNPFFVHPDHEIRQVVVEMVKRRITAVPVIAEGEELVGFLSLTDVAVDSVVQHDEGQRRVKEIMQRRVYTIDAAANVVTAVRELQERRVHRLVVTQSDRVVGMVSCLDLLGAVLEGTGYPPVM